MKSTRYRVSGVGVFALLATLGLPGSSSAQDTSTFVWENSTELSFISTGGNASSSTLGLRSTLIGTGSRNIFKLELGGIRGETTFRTVTATGTETDFTVTETTNSELTAENYFVRARYDRAFSRAFVFLGSGWDRNTFAGVQNRYAFVAGLGRTWIEGETRRFKTDLGGTYTIQKDVDPAPGADDAFLGARLTVDAKHTLSESAEFTSVLIVDENLEDTEDVRADWTNSLTMSLSARFAFKTSLQLLFDNQPSLLDVPLFDVGGLDTGTNVLTPGDEVDRVLTITLVIKV